MINHAVPAAELDGFVRDLADRIALTDPQMLGYQKRLINDQFDMMGFRQIIQVGIYMDTLGHRSKAMEEFVRVRNEQGLAAAIELRHGQRPRASNDGNIS
jgi:enoyl-CoA hydratase/carnithine racemase